MSVNIQVNSPDVTYTDNHITAKYSYQTTTVHREGNNIMVIFFLMYIFKQLFPNASLCLKEFSIENR